MPDATPVYGIPYPCPGDTIDAGVFADFANAVDAAMTSVTASATSALNRPSAKIARVGFDSIVANVDTQMVFDTELWDNDGMANVPAVDALTVQTAGSYLVFGTVGIQTTAGAFDSAEISLRINGTTHYLRRDDSESGVDVNMYISGVFDAVPGDVFTLFAMKNGAGTADANGPVLSARLTNRP